MSTLASVNGRGTAASRPAAGIAGALYLATDTAPGTWYRDNGSSWDIQTTSNPMTTAGDIPYGGASGVPTRLPAGTSAQALMGGTTPSWGPGAWSSYSPALTAATTNPTLGSGSSVLGKYQQIGKLVVVHGRIIFGASGVAAGSGEYHVSFPVNAATDDVAYGSAILYDSSAGLFTLAVPFASSATVFRIAIGTTALFVADNQPWTWAANDLFRFHVVYEAA